MLSLNTIIAIDMGHTLSGPDYGTSAIREESLLTREVGEKVIAKLKLLGYKVVNCTCDKASNISNSLYYRYNTANQNGANIFVSIHFNATPGGYGVEVYTMNAKELPEARAVLNNICSLGYHDRGIKDGSGLAVIRHTNMPAMLVECAFVDSQEDMNRYNAEDIASAIVQGLTGQTVKPDNSNSDFIKSVQHDLQRVSCLESGEANATGVIDAKTKAAIKQFRYVVDLPSSENIDDSLVNALNVITKMPTIGPGWEANVVATKFIQWYLGLAKTGVVDSKMTQFIKEWQIENKIWSPSGADGVIRANPDWNKILK